LVAILPAIAESACGGNDSDESVHGSAAAIDPVHEICTDLREAIDERGDFPVDDFDPENPAPQDLPAVGEYFAALAIAREMSGLRYTRARRRLSSSQRWSLASPAGSTLRQPVMSTASPRRRQTRTKPQHEEQVEGEPECDCRGEVGQHRGRACSD